MEMPNFSKTAQSFAQWLNEQEWYQPIKAKWDELDPQSRSYLQFLSLGVSAALIAYLLFSSLWRVHSLKREVSDKSEMLAQIQAANDDLLRLRSLNSGNAGGGAIVGGAGSVPGLAVGGDNGPWPPYFEGFAGPIGIGHDNLSVSEGKPGTANDLSKEVLYDITIKKINVHQMVRYAYALESGVRSVKLRNLVINTQPDMSGYLDATLSVSAFVMLNPER